MNSSSGETLFKSIQNEDLNAVNILLNNGITNLEERDQDGQTFLMVACQTGNYDVVKRLLDESTHEVNAVDNDNWTALLNAARHGSAKILSVLLDSGADIEHRDLGSWTALMWACYKGRTEAAIELLTKDANPNVKGEHHMSCLTWAAGRGHTRIVKELLAHDAKVNTADKYGTTPLIWAARKGHADIVKMLLDEGAIVDKAGMNSWTALIVAATGGYADVVQTLLEHHPYVNALDKDGYTALAIAAKEGYTEIVNMLLQKEAYVNLPDRYGDTILIHAVKGNHVDISRALLKKYADVDVQGIDDKTALYWATEKGYVAMAKLLLEFNANTEIANKDGDTPLLRAVRKRNLDLVQLLIDNGAKVSACDKRGDNALHVTVRGRSKRITECLLRNPKNARLLYNKNKSLETAYEIDATHERSVLTQVFGARNLNADDHLQGYELYSSTIADVLSEPSLRTPITVGLFARWGSGKSFLLNRLRKEMEMFAQLNADPWFEFSLLQFFVSLTVSVIAGLTFGTVFHWSVGLGVGGGLLILQYTILVMIWYGADKREWSVAIKMSVYLAKKFEFLKLLLQLMFCNVPIQTNRDTSAIRFMFTDNARLSTLTGEKSIAGILGTLCDALENEYGILVPRLYRIFKPRKAIDHGRFKSLCCIPYFLIVLLILICIISVVLLVVIFGFNGFTSEKYIVINGIMITLTIVIGLAVLGNVYTWSRMLIHVAVPSRKYVQNIARKSADIVKMDGFVQMLKKEVETIGRMTRCMDAFSGNHSRLVIIIDGLDSCEQDKLLQVLDMVHMLFGDTNSPFVTILAVDPHVIIKGIEHNLNSNFHESSINGHDYLRNIIQLPFFIQSQTIPKPPPRNATRLELNATDPSKLIDSGQSVICHRQESCMSTASYLSLTDIGKGGKGSKRPKPNSAVPANANFGGSTTLIRQPSMYDLSKSLGKSSYFSDINPRNMKRLMNILAVTGRLLRAHNIDFNWFKLASWINITEQWPYRLSWIILEVEDNNDIEDVQSLKFVYDRVSPKIPSSKDVDPLLEIDRNVRKLEVFLTNNSPPLTVADMRRFLPCTINVDPYLRKLIRELQQNNENINAEYGLYVNNMASSFDHMGSLGWPAGRSTGTRRPHGGSPRQTPTRPYALMHQHQSSNLNPMCLYPPPSMLMHQMYMQMLEMQQGTHTKPVETGPKIRINIQGDSGKKMLSSMSCDDVSQLVQRIEGLSKDKIPEYADRLKVNNITGLVLLYCNLSELKPVMQMSFGDWELFQGMIAMLRDRELNSGITAGDENKASYAGETGGSVSPGHVIFTQAVPTFNNMVEIPKASYPSSSGTVQPQSTKQTAKRILSDITATKVSSTITEFGSGSLSSSTPNFRRQASNVNPAKELQKQNFSNDAEVMNQQLLVPPKTLLNRQDSFVNEVIMESEALRDFIEAAVESSGSETEELAEVETQRGISPIPEEELPNQEISRQSSCVSLIGHQVLSRRASQESYNPGNKVFLVGPDDDSGESDSSEVERLSRKSSTVHRRSVPRSPQKSHQTNVNATEGDIVLSSSHSVDSQTTSLTKHQNVTSGKSPKQIHGQSKSSVKVERSLGSDDSPTTPLMSSDARSASPLLPASHLGGSTTSILSKRDPYYSSSEKGVEVRHGSSDSPPMSKSAGSSYQESNVKKFLGGQQPRTQSSRSIGERLSLQSLPNVSSTGSSSSSAFVSIIPSAVQVSSLTDDRSTVDNDNVMLNMEDDDDASSELLGSAIQSKEDEAQVKINAEGSQSPRVTYINMNRKQRNGSEPV